MTNILYTNSPQAIDWSAIGVIIASIIGLISIFLTIITLRAQHKHDRLSVKPIGMITFADYESSIGVSLQNRGTGPLIIEVLEFKSVNGTIKSSLIDFFQNDYSDIAWDTWLSNIDGRAILPGEHENLIRFSGTIDDAKYIEQRDRIRKKLSEITTNLKYKNIYGDRMPMYERALTFFAREK